MAETTRSTRHGWPKLKVIEEAVRLEAAGGVLLVVALNLALVWASSS